MTGIYLCHGGTCQGTQDGDAPGQADTRAAQARHTARLREQAQALLDEAGLSEAGRQAMNSSGVDSLDKLRSLDRFEEMGALGLGIADRRLLGEFIETLMSV
eukprot:COSAG01_NODE_215_length_21709_cov_141.101217_17_plen_102_part_00